MTTEPATMTSQSLEDYIRNRALRCVEIYKNERYHGHVDYIEVEGELRCGSLGEDLELVNHSIDRLTHNILAHCYTNAPTAESQNAIQARLTREDANLQNKSKYVTLIVGGAFGLLGGLTAGIFAGFGAYLGVKALRLSNVVFAHAKYGGQIRRELDSLNVDKDIALTLGFLENKGVDISQLIEVAEFEEVLREVQNI